MNVYVGNRLPSTYQEVEYIQSNSSGAGTSSTGQYINTGYKPNNKTKAVFKIGNWTNTGSSSNDIFGEDNGWSVASGFSLIAGYYNFGVGVTYAHNFNDGNIHTGEFSQQGLYKDGTLLVTPSTYTFTGLDLYLFALNRSGVVQEHSSGRIYYFKLYDNGTLVRDFVPCYRKSDGVIGLYDLVNDQFYTNSGTGTFTKGSDTGPIQSELKNAYIGEYTKLAYWKFDNNLIDETGNTTATGLNISYGTIGSKHYVQNTATGSNSYISVSGNLLSKIGTGDFTVSLWVYLPSMSGTNLPYLFGEWYDAASPRPGIVLRYFLSSKKFGVYITSDGFSSTHSTFNRWYHVCTTRVNGYISLYIDGVSELTPYQDTTDLSIGSSHVFFLNGRTGYAEGTRPVTGGKLSEVIYDSKGWSSSEVSSYFTSLKSNYGL